MYCLVLFPGSSILHLTIPKLEQELRENNLLSNKPEQNRYGSKTSVLM